MCCQRDPGAQGDGPENHHDQREFTHLPVTTPQLTPPTYNPETYSTDFDVPDKLYFEELSYERVMDICKLPPGAKVNKPEEWAPFMKWTHPTHLTNTWTMHFHKVHCAKYKGWVACIRRLNKALTSYLDKVTLNIHLDRSFGRGRLANYLDKLSGHGYLSNLDRSSGQEHWQTYLNNCLDQDNPLG